MVTIYLKIGAFNLTPSKQFIKDRDYQYFSINFNQDSIVRSVVKNLKTQH